MRRFNSLETRELRDRLDHVERKGTTQWPIGCKYSKRESSGIDINE